MLLSNNCVTETVIAVKMYVSVRQGDCIFKPLGDHPERFTDCTHEQLIPVFDSATDLYTNHNIPARSEFEQDGSVQHAHANFEACEPAACSYHRYCPKCEVSRVCSHDLQLTPLALSFKVHIVIFYEPLHQKDLRLSKQTLNDAVFLILSQPIKINPGTNSPENCASCFMSIWWRC